MAEISVRVEVNGTREQRAGQIWLRAGDCELYLSLNQAIPDIVPIVDASFRAHLVAKFDMNHDGEFDMSETDAITIINCEKLEISTLAGIEFFGSLTSLDCSSNPLTTLDVSKNLALRELYCNENQLTTLDLSKNTKLTYLNCNGTPITTIYLSFGMNTSGWQYPRGTQLIYR